ncbi:MAG: hypothetical protein BGO49_27985 [Planctomycetales bacterium 71-10]|nr:MAG: hypothetical protein BGO49_27985 [Planctomycetales bacterium 71-10]
MFTSLHTIARLGVLSLAASSLAALTAAQLRPEAAPKSSAPNPWQAVSARGAGMELVHREDGRTRRLAAPRSERWEYVSTSPWACEDGSMEAVARFATLNRDAWAEEGSVGLVRLRLPEGEVLERIETDAMPTGRAAWDPAGGDRVVFPGSTGRLYSYGFGQGPAGEGSTVAALEWRGAPPEGREPFMIDPSWPQLPGPKRFLLVSMSPAQGMLPAGTSRPIAPWWLELDEDGQAIVDAGPLFDPEDPIALDPRGRIRHPSVIERDGRPRLLFLRYEPMQGGAAIYLADLDLDPATGRPSVRPGTVARVGDRATALGPLIPSLDYQPSSPNDESGRALTVLFASFALR